MATLGSVVVEMSASTAKFESDLGRAAQMAERNLAQIDRAVGLVKAGLQTLGVAVTLGLVIDQVKSKIESAIRMAADLNDLADQTGAAVESLSGLAAVAKMSNTDMGALATGLQRLSKAVVDAQNGGKQTTAAFKALGISIESLQGLGPDEVFMRMAQQMDKYRDGVEKTTIAQVLMGRGGANLLTVAKDLATVGDMQVRVTTEQAAAADELYKNLVRLQLSTQGLSLIVAMELVPVYNDFLTTLIRVISTQDGVSKSARDLANEGSIRKWAQDTAIGVAIVAESIMGVAKLVYAIAGSFSVVLADSAVGIAWVKKAWDDLESSGHGSDAGLKAALESRASIIADANARYADLLKDGTVLSTELRKQFDASNKAGATNPATVKTPLATPDISGLGNQNKFRDDPFKKILEGQIKALEDAIAAEGKLLKSREQMLDAFYGMEFLTLREAETRKQALLADNLASVRAAYDEEIRLAQQAMARRGATQVQIAEANNKAEEAMRKRTAAEIEANKAIVDSQLKLLAVQARFDLATRERARQADLDNASALFAIAMMGKTTLEVLKLNAVRQIQLDLEERIRQLRKQDPNVDTSEAMANAAIQTANATSLIEQAYNKQRDAIFGASEAVRKYQEDAANAAAQVENAMNRAFQGMEDALVRFVTTGKLSFADLANSIVADITRIIVKQMMASAMGGNGSMGWLGSLLGSVAGSLFGMSGTAAVASTMGGDALENMLSLTNAFGTAPSRASGGPVSAMGLYQVNEEGPELLNVGGRQYLLMDEQDGEVTPYATKPSAVNVINHFNFNTPVDRRTQAQIAAQAGLSVQRAMSRNT
jgi:lambda family phage tail tape measure protein